MVGESKEGDTRSGFPLNSHSLFRCKYTAPGSLSHGCIRRFDLLASGVWMGIMSGRNGLFACEVMVVLLVAAGKDEGSQIKTKINK